MSLRTSPTRTPARIEANRRNARKLTGPRTARGKGQSRMNSLRTGVRSGLMHKLHLTVLNAAPYAVDRVARTILTPEQAAHPLFAETVDMFREAEITVALQQREILARVEFRKSAEYCRAGLRPAGGEGMPSAGLSGRRGDPGGPQKELLSKIRAKPECY